jgi:nucleotide-binding universal stress UspA family protein
MRRKRIVIAVDNSSGSRDALEAGCALALASGAIATLVYVRRPRNPLGDPFYQCALTEDFVRARAAFGEAEAVLAETDVEWEAEILDGDPADCILELARARGADLIVVGSRGRGAITEALLGSVSNEIVHKADRPVLVAKQRYRARLAA